MALLLGLGVPFSLAGSFWMLSTFGFTLNMTVLLGIITVTFKGACSPAKNLLGTGYATPPWHGLGRCGAVHQSGIHAALGKETEHL